MQESGARVEVTSSARQKKKNWMENDHKAGSSSKGSPNESGLSVEEEGATQKHSPSSETYFSSSGDSVIRKIAEEEDQRSKQSKAIRFVRLHPGEKVIDEYGEIIEVDKLRSRKRLVQLVSQEKNETLEDFHHRLEAETKGLKLGEYTIQLHGEPPHKKFRSTKDTSPSERLPEELDSPSMIVHMDNDWTRNIEPNLARGQPQMEVRDRGCSSWCVDQIDACFEWVSHGCAFVARGCLSCLVCCLQCFE